MLKYAALAKENQPKNSRICWRRKTTHHYLTIYSVSWFCIKL